MASPPNAYLARRASLAKAPERCAPAEVGFITGSEASQDLRDQRNAELDWAWTAYRDLSNDLQREQAPSVAVAGEPLVETQQLLCDLTEAGSPAAS